MSAARPIPRTATPAAAAVALRIATPGDLEFVSALSQQAFACYGDYSGVLPAWLTSPAVETILAEEGSGLAVGFAMLGARRPRRLSAGGELLALAVVADRRSQGIGRLLVEEIERRARAARMRELRLSTAASNLIARRLYASLGFAVITRCVRFYPAGQSALEMAKQL